MIHWISGEDLPLLVSAATLDLRMLRVTGAVNEGGQTSMHLPPRGRVVGLLNGLQREMGHRAVIHAVDQRVVGILLVRAPTEQDLLHLGFRVLGLALRLRLPGILQHRVSTQRRIEEAYPPVV